MKSNSTLLDYTKSAEEIRKFKLKEECHKIDAEYEKFNVENRVYEKFGEYLLEKAKNSYSLGFDSGDLRKILTESEAECPEQKKIDAMREDYFWCEELREICPDEWSFRMCYRSSYTWYTLWKIAKAYNGNYGCVVRVSPREKYREFWFVLDWSQDANDCISKEKWRSESEPSKSEKTLYGLIGFVVVLFFPLFIFIVFGLKTNLFIWIVCICSTLVLFPSVIGELVCRKRMNVASKPFKDHCEKISQTKESEFDVESGKVIHQYYSRWM